MGDGGVCGRKDYRIRVGGYGDDDRRGRTGLKGIDGVKMIRGMGKEGPMGQGGGIRVAVERSGWAGGLIWAPISNHLKFPHKSIRRLL